MADRKNSGPSVDARLSKILRAQYRNFTADPHPHLLCVVDERDIRVWYFLAGGLDTPYLHGEFIFKLTAPDDFPQKPPRFEFCTANGVFLPGGPICISVGEFHANDRPGKDGSHGWRASLGMKGFAIQVVNGLICYEGLEIGIRIKNRPNSMKAMYAKISRAHNARDFPEIYHLFEAIIESPPESEPVRNITNARLRLEGKTPPPRQTPPAAAALAVAPKTVVAPPLRIDNLAASAADDSLLDDLLGDKKPAPVAAPAEDGPMAYLLGDKEPAPVAAPAEATVEIRVTATKPVTPTTTPPAPDEEMESLINSLLDD